MHFPRATSVLIALLASVVAIGPDVAAQGGGRGAAPTPEPDHAGQYPAADIAFGARVYSANCANCHGPTGTGVVNIDLRRGPLPRASTDIALRGVIANGIAAGMPPQTLEPGEITGLIAFIRSGFDAGTATTLAVGDASKGRLVFETKGQCLTCHRVGDTGSFAGPDLSDIGRLRQPPALQRTLVDPTGSMQPINRPVRAVKRDGTIINGRRLNEDLYTVQLITVEGRLASLVKSELKEWTVTKASTMPSYKDTLTSAELSDVIGYLVSLKTGPAPGPGRGGQ
jgi:putative heme-binding domain-containing protein